MVPYHRTRFFTRLINLLFVYLYIKMSFDKSILVYSSHCPYSIKFLKMLTKDYPTVYDSIIRMNIDVSPETQKRPQIFYQVQNLIGKRIEKVPSMILTNGRILVDDAIYTWLDFMSVQPQHGQQIVQQTNQIQQVNSAEDSFGTFQTDNNFTPSKSNSTSEKKKDVDNRLQDLINERNQIDEQFKQRR